MRFYPTLAALIFALAVAFPCPAKQSKSDAPRSWTQLLWSGEAPHPKVIRPDAAGNVREPRELGDTAKLHIFLPSPSQANGKAVVLCPGGSYEGLAIDHEGYGWAPFFNEQGIALIVLQYRVPGGRRELPIEDVQEALRMVRRNAIQWNINPNAVGVGGSSAGGHLASTASTHFASPINPDTISCRPDFAILFYPVITMMPEYTHPGSRANLLGPSMSCLDEIAFSNELQVTPDTPRTIIFYSSDDDVVHPFNGTRYYEALLNAGVPASLHVYPSGGHGWGVRSDFKYHVPVLNELSAWLRSF